MQEPIQDSNSGSSSSKTAVVEVGAEMGSENGLQGHADEQEPAQQPGASTSKQAQPQLAASHQPYSHYQPGYRQQQYPQRTSPTAHPNNRGPRHYAQAQQGSNGQLQASSDASSSHGMSQHSNTLGGLGARGRAGYHNAGSNSNSNNGSPASTSASGTGSTTRLPRPSETFTRQFSNVLQHVFLPSVLPTPEEYKIKENARKFLQDLADRIAPGAKLLPFGSQANGMALRNSDMDLCYIGPPGQGPRPASELVEILGKLIEAEAPHFRVKMLPRARIPIIKLSMPAGEQGAYDISCDIGFENRLALENTRLLLTYAMIDPRLRTIVLFLKVWSKRRKINNPYLGTLSSYGYVLLVIHYLTNGRKPGVLPNLQRLQPPTPRAMGQAEFEGRDIYFFDDLELLSRCWTSSNRDSVGELLIGFFYYYFKEFNYTFDVVSIRTEGGLLDKRSKGWNADERAEVDYNAPRDFYRLSIEDPFQTDYNVARTVTMDGLFTMRGEIARAVTILRSARTETSETAIIAELVEEREDYLIQAPAPSSTNRRRSAPSPRLQPSVLATHNDFKAWAMANGVPHAPGTTNGPVYSHQLQPSPLVAGQGKQHQQQFLQPNLQLQEANGIDLSQLSAEAQQQLQAGSAEALARFHEASQALSQANLQQHQALAAAAAAAAMAGNNLQTNGQQRFMANLPALLAATNLRNYRQPHMQQQQLGRRFQDQRGYSRTFRQQPPHHASQQQQQYHQVGNVLGSPTQSTSGFLHPSYQSMKSYQRAGGELQSGDPGSHTLERRSSWDGGQANSELKSPVYVGSSSVSEAGGGAGHAGSFTAPTSPVATNTSLGSSYPGSQHFVGISVPASDTSTPSPSVSTFQQPFGGMGRASRDINTLSRSSGHASNSHQGYRGRQYRQNRDEHNIHSPYQPYYGSAEMSQQVGLPLAALPPLPASLPASRMQHEIPMASTHDGYPPPLAFDDRNDSGARPPSGQQPTNLGSTGLSATGKPEAGSREDEEDIPAAGSIKFGNFDAAFYSSEPAEMAALGLFDGIEGVDSPAVSASDHSLERLSTAEELPLPPPVQAASSAPTTISPSQNSSLPRQISNARAAVLRFRPGLADIPASPAKRSTPPSPKHSRRPSMHNRRKSAGDEADLGVGDITFFGNVPVNKDESQRKQAMAALLKESAKDSRPPSLTGSVRKPRRTSTSSSTTNDDSSSLPQLGNILPSSTSSSASVTSISTTDSPSDAFRSDASSLPLPSIDIMLPSSTERSTPVPFTDSAARQPKSPSKSSTRSTSSTVLAQATNSIQVTGKGQQTAPSYASLAASPAASSQRGTNRRRTGT